ncbi:hypothetical protein D9615_006018 [Tricholomella constricta]|uniref:Chromatin target of PRMT1 protein C-terminal domain-containing protein n=1 Tax=Tricholomella constricta TaxID=117010 RepID=A0A8H5M3A4_9AGAR|nr:hypothetical protein D9615_006018 [Tricholomella constricta]
MTETSPRFLGQLITAPLCFSPSIIKLYLSPTYPSYHTEKPMKIEIVVAPAPVSLASRVAPAAAAAAAAAPANGAVPRTGGRAGRRGRGGKAGGGRKERPAKSAADLDAEMEDYTASNAPAAAPAAAAAT